MLGNMLHEHLKENELSIRAAAREIGVAHSTLGRLLDGETIDFDTYIQVCDWLNLSPADMLHSEGKIGSMSEIASRMAIILQTSPSLAQVFDEVTQKYRNGKISIDTVKDIVAYAGYRLGIDEMED